MNTEEQDDLWQLLGKARQPTVSPFFSRNVLREVRNLRQESGSGFFGWTFGRWQIAAVAACAVLIAAGTLLKQPDQTEDQTLMAIAETVSESPDYQVIAHLDELLDQDESSVWLESSNVY